MVRIRQEAQAKNSAIGLSVDEDRLRFFFYPHLTHDDCNDSYPHCRPGAPLHDVHGDVCLGDARQTLLSLAAPGSIHAYAFDGRQSGVVQRLPCGGAGVELFHRRSDMERERPPVFPRLRGCGRDVWRANGVEEDLLCAGLARHRGDGLRAGEGLNRHTAVSKSYSEPFATHGVGLFRGRKGATELLETLAAAFEGSVSFVETLLFPANRSRGCCSGFCVCTKSVVDVFMYLYDSRKICLICCPVYMYTG